MKQLNGLKALEEHIIQDLQYLNLPLNRWSLSPNSTDNHQLDVAIIGAGMSGITAAFALKLQGVEAIVFDQAPEGNEGPWKQPALMETLRSPKHVVGPALASPSLTFQAWFKAQFGTDAWEALDKIPRLQWDEYLQWFKKMTAPTVLNEYQLIDTQLNSQGCILTFQTHHGQQQYQAQHVILATGMESFSEPNIPDFMDGIPHRYWEHSYTGSDYSRFDGLDIAVVGYSAGAMDSSATALEHGARSVELLIRAKDMPRVNRGKVAGNPGFTQAYEHLTDAQKWHYSDYVVKAKTPAPHGSTLRVSRHDNAYFNFDTQIKQIDVKDDKLHLSTTTGNYVVDYLILATGYRINWQRHNAFSNIAPFIRTWADMYTPPNEEQNAEFSAYPYLGGHFEFLPKAECDLPELSNIYCFNLAASLSMGPMIGLIPNTNTSAQKLAEHIAAKLYLAYHEQHLQQVKQSTEAELLGDEWQPALPYQQRVKQTSHVG
ncbi:NAD(P)-binding domain-containing protein [Providencia vermicola]|uniref:NAD(P)/FAD-dependent oxidoreductase n=1 Tax=Providencia vermicola TaxID=333965 RepID=A0AAX3S318_9GAMM|nr:MULTISPECIES: NAD(P)/FAD-dependent oxidoreductase [Providencia]ELX8379557.1 NAD(P)/FAD-dependent oxidoreductase [Providencia stuartii]EMD5258761.1 NAD(P)/FAD-dependent oxidoreductase [Providencia stuartii]USB35687.1 NAD(P)/FAD-dependent oxidoreductase [Providencia vermicola]WFC08194.1 NAD(P)/FAD-dependent oxidoreductase [Providencia vermicola]